MTNSKKFGGLPPAVLVLGVIALFNDMSSEMIYPLLPLFLVKELGSGPAFLGLIEGVADATACLITLIAGAWADRTRDRAKLVRWGYTLASCARSLTALAPNPLAVLFIRFTDRLGKGIRTSPRDAIIGDSVDSAHHGRAYGYERAMDNAGAVIGPLAASLLILCGITRLRVVFGLAAIPALLVVILVAWKVHEPNPERKLAEGTKWSLEPPTAALRNYLMVLFLFSLSQSTDAFLLLRASGLGIPLAQIPVLWAVFNLFKIFSGLPFSEMSDKVGRRPVIVAGWGIYALTYLGFAFASKPMHVWALFCIYGLFYGLTEGPERALLAGLAAHQRRATAFGWYNFTSGVALLLASVLFGLVWQIAGAKAAFVMGAAISVSAAALFMAINLPGNKLDIQTL